MIPILLQFCFALVLLLGSAFFSASETALVSLSTAKVKRLALKNPHIAQALLSWLEKPQELLIVILVGNTLTLVVFAAVATTLAINIFDQFPASRVAALAWLTQTIILVIVAEMAPKLFARTNAEKISAFALPWLSRLRKLLRPLVYLITKLIHFATPKSPTRSKTHELKFSMEELKAVIEEDSRRTPTEQDSLNMMHKALKMNDTRVEKIMMPMDRVDLIELHPPGRAPKTQDQIIDFILEEGHTRTPIRYKGKFLGFLHSDDLLPLFSSTAIFDVKDKIRPALEISSSQKVNELLSIFRNSGIHMAFVYDPNQTIIGIVTFEDVLEEITGEIIDEYDLSDFASGSAS